MDLIGTLTSQLNIDGGKAEGLAGSVLGTIQDAVGEKFGADSAAQLASAVPELGGWKQKAAALLGGGDSDTDGGMGGLLSGLAGGGGGGGDNILGAVAGALGGGGGVAGLIGILGKLGIDSSKLSVIAPLVLSFLQQRTDGGLMDKIKAVAPFLLGGGGADGGSDEAGGDLAGGIGKALGGLF